MSFFLGIVGVENNNVRYRIDMSGKKKKFLSQAYKKTFFTTAYLYQTSVDASITIVAVSTIVRVSIYIYF